MNKKNIKVYSGIKDDQVGQGNYSYEDIFTKNKKFSSFDIIMIRVMFGLNQRKKNWN